MNNFSRLILGLLTCHSAAFANTIVVNTANNEFQTPSTGPNTGSTISLREAIRDAGQGTATICFDSSLSGSTIYVDSSPLRVTSPSGNPGGTIVIDASDLESPVTITHRQPNNPSSTLSASFRNVTLKNLILTRENIDASAVIMNDGDFRLENTKISSESGKALSVFRGTLNMKQCEIDKGTGINLLDMDSVTITDSSIYHLRGPLDIRASDTPGAVLIENSTFAENYSPANAPGAVQIKGSFPSITVRHCSFVDNVNAGLSSPDSTQLSYSLFARNSAMDGTITSIDESGSNGATSAGYNLADDNPSSLGATTDLTNTDALVSRIGYFGGRMNCCFPLAGSPAIDGGNPNRMSLIPSADSRGYFRNASSSFSTNSNPIDLGAVETNPHGSIIITSSADSGPGTLRNAITDALGQANTNTHHLIIDDSLDGDTLDLQSQIFIEDTHNLNIDGSALSSPLKITGEIEQALINFSSHPGDFAMSGSLTSITFDNYRVVNPRTSRPALLITGGTRIGLQKVNFTDCAPVSSGALDVFNLSHAWLDECLFEGNRQRVGSIIPAVGGSAITVREATIDVWNSTFLANTTDIPPNADGGAVRVDPEGQANFRSCTFALNETTRYGGAIHYSENGVDFARGDVLNCSFRRNTANQGAVSCPSFTNLSFSGCAFYDNINRDLDTPATVDLYPGEQLGNTVLGFSPNWSNATATSRNLATTEIAFSLAPSGDFGGCVPTSPFITGSNLVGPFNLFDFLPRDAQREVGLLNDGPGGLNRRVLPGAVQTPVTADSVIAFSDFEDRGTELRYTISGVTGIPWRLEVSTDFVNWTPVNRFFNGGVSPEVFFLPSPRPPRYFIRFREVR